MIKACQLRLVETLDDRQHRRVDKTDIGIGVAEPSSLQKMPLSRNFLSEPTPGLEPGTPSLRVTRNGLRPSPADRLIPANWPLGQLLAPMTLRLFPGLLLPSRCP
jgi:hypothetical protein